MITVNFATSQVRAYLQYQIMTAITSELRSSSSQTTGNSWTVPRYFESPIDSKLSRMNKAPQNEKKKNAKEHFVDRRLHIDDGLWPFQVLVYTNRILQTLATSSCTYFSYKIRLNRIHLKFAGNVLLLEIYYKPKMQKR